MDKHDILEKLDEIDTIMGEIDLFFEDWWGHLDRISLAGIDVPLQLWTNDDPPIVVTISNMENTLQVNKTVRIMHFKDGEWGQIGMAVLDHTGALRATITDQNLWPDDEELNNHPFFKNRYLWDDQKNKENNQNG